jgi:hypothetical protein
MDADSLQIGDSATTYPTTQVTKDAIGVYGGLSTGFVGAFMDSKGSGNAGRAYVTDSLGLTTVWMRGNDSAIEFRQDASYTPTTNYGALQNQSGDLYWYKTGTGWQQLNVAGTSLPVADTTSIVEGSGDNTKEIRFEVDGLTTLTTRIITPPDANIDLAGTNIANTWSQDQTFSLDVFVNDDLTVTDDLTVSGNVSSDLIPKTSSYDLGSAGIPWDRGYFDLQILVDAGSNFNKIDADEFRHEHATSSDRFARLGSAGGEFFVTNQYANNGYAATLASNSTNSYLLLKKPTGTTALRFDSNDITDTDAPAAGSINIPTQSVGLLVVTINGTDYVIPYFTRQ